MGRRGEGKVVRQTHADGCGPACGEMLLRDRGYEVDQHLIAQELALPVSAEHLAGRMSALAPARWIGAFRNQEGGASWGFVAGLTAERVSWAARLEPAGFRSAGHWVVVDGISDDGMVRIRDPRGVAHDTPIEDFLGLWH